MTALLDQLFARLPGAWRIARTINDSRLGDGHFKGVAMFKPRAEGALHYSERGELCVGAWKGPAYRDWLYVHAPGTLSVLYPDGQRSLHRFAFEPNATHAAHTHVCGDDLYHATLSVSEAHGFTLTYAVEGPSKRYRLNSVYHRQIWNRERHAPLRI